MSVIIQEMIEGSASGIAFTANPKGLLSEMVIVAGKGSGDLIVEDKVPITTYYYNLEDSNYYYEKQDDSIVLEKELVAEIAKTANELKEMFGKHLDIEFSIAEAVVYILQARPITTLKIEKSVIYDNSNIVESYPNITLPLTASFVKEAYYSVFHGLSKRILSSTEIIEEYDHLLKSMVDSVNGRMYYNINNWYTLINFLPFSKKIIPIWQEMLGISHKKYNIFEEIRIKKIKKIKACISFAKQFLRTPGEMEKLNERYDEVSRHFRKSYKIDLDNEALLKLYEDIAEKVLKVWDVTLINDLYAFINVGLLKYCFKKKKIEAYEAAVNKYISGITNIESMKPIRELIEMVRLALEENKIEDLKSVQRDEDLKQFLEEDISAFTEKFKQYVDIYGDRCFEELKLESKTFRSAPRTLVKKILEYAEDKEKLINIYSSFTHEENNLSLEELIKDCSWLEKKVINFISTQALLGIKNREASRLNRSRIYGMVRTIFMKLGENLARLKLIEDKDDIFYLKVQEVFDFISAGKINIKELVVKRKQHYEIYSKLPSCSRLVFTKELFNKKHFNINSEVMFENSTELLGIPCSNGKVTGEVIVVEDPRTVKGFKDKILVTKMTDPGWVFLLTLAKGIIAEKGSLLSHTAIISRELKIPSIVAVKNVTKVLKTGDIVTMNGNTGEIILEKKGGYDV